MRRPVLLLALLASVLLAPATAHAGTVTTSGGKLVYAESVAGETNTLTVRKLPSGEIQFADGAGVTGCGALLPTSSVTCPPQPNGLSISLGSGDDLVLVGNGAADVAPLDGGPGADAVDFHTHTTGVSLTADNAANDGGPGEHDDVRGFERYAGGAGNDTFAGATGADRFTGGAGTDTVSYANRAAPVVAGPGGGANDGQAGEHDDIGADVESVTGGTANDDLSAGAGSATLAGGNGDDVLRGGPGNDALAGGAGNDSMSGGAGADTFDGGPSGIDTANYSGRAEALSVSLNDTADDGAGGERDDVRTNVDTVLGGGGNDHLSGSTGADTLRGNGGDDTLDGGLGPDALAGGGGVDIASYANRTAPVTVALDGTAASGAAGEGDTIATDVENGRGGEGADAFRGTSRPNGFFGGPGRDRVSYVARREPLRISPNDKADDGAAGEKDDVAADVEDVQSGLGPDVITGSAAANEIAGGPGADVVDGGAGADHLIGNAGDDRLTGGRGDDRLEGNDGKDTLVAGPGRDRLSGGAGADTLSTRAGGVDVLRCGTGSDRATVDALDEVAKDCNTVDGDLDLDPPDVAVLTRVPRLTKTNRVKLKLRCPNEPRGCSGTVKVLTQGTFRARAGAKKKRQTLGTAKFRFKTARGGTVTVKVSKATRTFLGRHRSLLVRIRVSARDVLGNRAPLTTKLPLKP